MMDELRSALLSGEVVWPPVGTPEREVLEIELAAARCAARGHAPHYLTCADDVVVSATCACGEVRFKREVATPAKPASCCATHRPPGGSDPCWLPAPGVVPFSCCEACPSYPAGLDGQRDGETSMRSCSECGATCDVDVAAPTSALIKCSGCELREMDSGG